MCCLHSAGWWRRHWERTGIMDIDLADNLPDGWQLWRDWQMVIAPDNAAEIQALDADRGRYLGYVRLVGRRRVVLAHAEHRPRHHDADDDEHHDADREQHTEVADHRHLRDL